MEEEKLTIKETKEENREEHKEEELTFLTLTRRIKIYVLETDKELKKSFIKKLKDYIYRSRCMANEIMGAFSSQNSLEILKKQNPKAGIPLITDFFQSSQGKNAGQNVGLQSLGYSLTSEKYFSLLPSSIRGSLKEKVYKDFKNAKKDVLLGKRTFSSYKQGIPIYFVKKAFVNFKKAEKDKNFTFQLFGIPFKTTLGRDKSNNEAIIDSILNGTYKLADSSIQFKDGDFYLNIVYKQKFVSQKDKLDANKILGADMGIVCPISYSIFGTKIRGEIGSREDFLVQRKRLSRRREQIHKGLTQTSGGKGRKHKLKKLNHYTEKERRFVNYKNHCYSKELISIALRNGCGTIHIEDLEGIGREVTNKFILRNWSYFELQMMIKNKAKKEGIVVVKVNREYTSQRCSVCGNINKDNRIEQDRFVCTKCGFTENADYNASQNICIAETAEFKKQVVEHKKWLKENKLEDSDSDNDVFGVKIENKKINKKNKNKVVQLNS